MSYVIICPCGPLPAASPVLSLHLWLEDNLHATCSFFPFNMWKEYSETKAEVENKLLWEQQNESFGVIGVSSSVQKVKWGWQVILTTSGFWSMANVLLQAMCHKLQIIIYFVF